MGDPQSICQWAEAMSWSIKPNFVIYCHLFKYFREPIDGGIVEKDLLASFHVLTNLNNLIVELASIS